MRKESSNQFTEGLVCDLNPINTPNTALTDALNATIITYDGNEYSLQNDRGNYPLKHCRLKPNYIPVGVKEYGDILYIVSYNPINKNVEVGSYPSPLNVESSNEKPVSMNVESLMANRAHGGDYNEIMSDRKLHIYTGNGDEEEFKLYPGDEYKLEESSPSFIYEGLEYFIVDEDKKKHDVTDVVTFGQWSKVQWQVPGWLAIQYRLANFDDFNLNIRSFTVPALSETETFTGTLKLNFQFKVSDSLFLNQSFKEDVYINLVVKKNGNQQSDLELSLNDGYLIEWFGDSKILGYDYTQEFSKLSQNDVLTIEATPFVRCNNKTITYSNLTSSQTIFIKNIGTVDDFKFAENIWKFYTEPNGTSLYLEYDVTGPSVTSSEVGLKYQILSIDETVIQPWEDLSGYTGVGDQNISEIKFDAQFTKENMYIFEFAFTSNNNIFKNNSTRRLVITSSLFNKYNSIYNNFKDITFNEWAISGYIDRFMIKGMSATAEFNPSKEPVTANYSWDAVSGDLVDSSKGLAFNNEVLRKLWNSTASDTKGWSPANDVSKNTLEEIKIRFEKKYDANINVKLTDANMLVGKLWANVPTPKFVLKTNSKEEKFEIENAKFTAPIVMNTNTVRGEEQTYTQVPKGSVFNHLGDSIRDINTIKTMKLSLNFDKNNANDKLKFELYDYGDYNLQTNSGGFTKSGRIKASVEVSETSYGISNAISNAISALMAQHDVGVIGIRVGSRDKTSNKTELSHGGTEIKTFTKGNDYYLYTYLVFKLNNRNYPILIPIQQDGLWGAQNYEFENKAGSIKTLLKNLFDNVKICTKKLALDSYRLLNIQLLKTESLSKDAYSLRLILPELTKWEFESKDLLKADDRNSLLAALGDSVCGKLLTSDKTLIDEIVVKEIKLYDRGEANVEEKKAEYAKKIAEINGKVKTPDVTVLDKTIMNKLNQRGDHRGVYTTSDHSASSLIELLDEGYRSIANDTLVGDKIGSGDLKFENKNDNDYLIVSKVSTGLSI